MANVTQILSRIEQGDPTAAEQLLPLVYAELRKLAAGKMAQEKPGQTLQATDLVHDAYLRLVDGDAAKHWDSRRHFFAAAAESMRRILVEAARRKRSLKRGGDRDREPISNVEIVASETPGDLCEIDEALRRLQAIDQEAAELVNLRFFAGLTSKQAADTMGISPRTADRLWVYARTWLLKEIQSV